MGLGNILLPTCRRHSPSDLRPIRHLRRRPQYDTGFKHQQHISRALGTACVRLSSTTQHPIDQQRTPNLPNHLCRSLCSQLARSPHDNHHRRRPCSQLARDHTTAHPAPTRHKPLLPTSKLAAHKLFQHPQVTYHPLFFCTKHKTKCVLLASVVTAA